MGEAKRKEAALAAAGDLTVKLTASQAMVGMLLDLCCHTMLGAAAQIGRELDTPKVADEVQKAINHLQKAKLTFLGTAPRIVAPPAGLIVPG